MFETHRRYGVSAQARLPRMLIFSERLAFDPPLTKPMNRWSCGLFAGAVEIMHNALWQAQSAAVAPWSSPHPQNGTQSGTLNSAKPFMRITA